MNQVSVVNPEGPRMSAVHVLPKKEPEYRKENPGNQHKLKHPWITANAHNDRTKSDVQVHIT
jgi:hypothetical protein